MAWKIHYISCKNFMGRCFQSLAVYTEECMNCNIRMVNAIEKFLLFQYMTMSVMTCLLLHNSWLTPDDIHCSWSGKHENGSNHSYQILMSGLCLDGRFNFRFSVIFLGLELASISLLLFKKNIKDIYKMRIRSDSELKFDTNTVQILTIIIKSILILKTLSFPFNFTTAFTNYSSAFGLFMRSAGWVLHFILTLLIRLITCPFSLVLPNPIRSELFIDFHENMLALMNNREEFKEIFPRQTREIRCREICEVNSSFFKTIITSLLLANYIVTIWISHVAEYSKENAILDELEEKQKEVSENVEFIRVSEISDDFNNKTMQSLPETFTCELCRAEKEVAEDKKQDSLIIEKEEAIGSQHTQMVDSQCQTQHMYNCVQTQTSINLANAIDNTITSTGLILSDTEKFSCVKQNTYVSEGTKASGCRDNHVNKWSHENQESKIERKLNISNISNENAEKILIEKTDSMNTENPLGLSLSHLSPSADIHVQEIVKQKSVTTRNNVEGFLLKIEKEEFDHEIHVDKGLLMNTFKDFFLATQTCAEGNNVCSRTQETAKRCDCHIHHFLRVVMKETDFECHFPVDGNLESIIHDMSDDESFFNGFRL